MNSSVPALSQPASRSSADAAEAFSPPAIVLVGCGAVSQQFYRPALLELTRRGEVRVAALVDPVADAGAKLAAHFPGARAVAALEAADAPKGSLAIIASPPRAHAAQARAALARGWHVLCEKPMASSSLECDAMLQAAREAERILAVGLYKRFFPTSDYIHALCRQKTLGRLRRVEVHEGGPFQWPAASPSFFRRAETPGGVLLDLGVHVLDLLLWWLGEPHEIDCADDAMGGIEANTVVRLAYADGATARVQLSRDAATRQRYRLEFEAGVVEWTVNHANELTLQLNGALAALRGLLVDADENPASTNPQCFIAQLRNVLAAMRREETVRVSGEDGARVARLIETCYAQRRALAQPWLEPAEQARARELSVLP